MTTDLEIVEVSGIRSPAGHYSHAVICEPFVFISGQFGWDEGDDAPTRAAPGLQTERCLRLIDSILKAAGSDLTKVVKVTVYVTDILMWPEVDAAYARMFGGHRPARAVVPVNELHYGFAVEIDAIAKR